MTRFNRHEFDDVRADEEPEGPPAPGFTPPAPTQLVLLPVLPPATNLSR
jgi:hypothetical protein